MFLFLSERCRNQAFLKTVRYALQSSAWPRIGPRLIAKDLKLGGIITYTLQGWLRNRSTSANGRPPGGRKKVVFDSGLPCCQYRNPATTISLQYQQMEEWIPPTFTELHLTYMNPPQSFQCPWRSQPWESSSSPAPSQTKQLLTRASQTHFFHTAAYSFLAGSGKSTQRYTNTHRHWNTDIHTVQMQANAHWSTHSRRRRTHMCVTQNSSH